MSVYNKKSNAERAARRLLETGKAPGDAYTLEPVDGGFQIAWTAQPAAPEAEPAVTHETLTNAQTGEEFTVAVHHPRRGRRSPSDPNRVLARDGAAPREKKQDMVIAMLRRPKGATGKEIQTATGWVRYTGFISGTVKKKLGIAVATEKVAGRGTVYRAA